MPVLKDNDFGDYGMTAMNCGRMRERASDENNNILGYVFIGKVLSEKTEGSKPISIKGNLMSRCRITYGKSP